MPFSGTLKDKKQLTPKGLNPSFRNLSPEVFSGLLVQVGRRIAQHLRRGPPEFLHCLKRNAEG